MAGQRSAFCVRCLYDLPARAGVRFRWATWCLSCFRRYGVRLRSHRFRVMGDRELLETLGAGSLTIRHLVRT